MNNIEYYKSLISDEEVIKALIKESKAREGELLREKARVRPNLNFFHRTVTNLVSSNRRVNPTKELAYSETQKTLYKSRGKIKTPHTLIKEIVMSNKIDFVKATGSKTELVEDDSNERLQDAVTITTCAGSTQPSKSASVVERTYKEDLNKYFVRATDAKTNSKRSAQSYKPFNADKSKNIVFNIKINKDSVVKLAKTSEEGSENKNQVLSIGESSDIVNLVTSYKRMNTTKETEKPAYKVRGKIKSPRTEVKGIVMTNNIDFVKATDGKMSLVEDSSVEKFADTKIDSTTMSASECEVIMISDSESN